MSDHKSSLDYMFSMYNRDWSGFLEGGSFSHPVGEMKAYMGACLAYDCSETMGWRLEE